MITQKDEEQWREIAGYEGLYDISDLGRVKSLPKRKFGKNYRSRHRHSFITKEKILTPQVGNNGYWKLTLCKDGNAKNHNVHRLLAVAFIGNPHNYPQVNHIDGDKLNLSLDNLEWCTASQNTKHAYDIIGITPSHLGRFGKDHPTSKPVVQKNTDGIVVQIWDSAMDAVRAGFDSSSISRCCNGIYKSHKGYFWEYD